MQPQLQHSNPTWFEYDTADSSLQGTFRLIEIITGTDLPLRCRLHTYQKSAIDNLTYTCLSYEWGPPEAEENMRIILLNDNPFRVRKSLWEFLVAARSRSSGTGSRIYGLKWWIDAICINQNSTEDKNEQVQRMGVIYNNAAFVVAWLGATSLDSAITVNVERLQSWMVEFKEYTDSLARIAEQNPDVSVDPMESMRHTDTTQEELDILIESTHSKYWTRAWVVQEILLAKECHIWMAQMEISLLRLAELYFHTLTDPTLSEDDPIVLKRTFTQEAILWHFAPKSLLQWVPTTQRRTLKDLLLEHEDVECFDPRDRVYSLLSLMKAGSGITVDYKGTKLQLFFVTLWACRDEFCFCLPLLLLQALFPTGPDRDVSNLMNDLGQVNRMSNTDRPFLEISYKVPHNTNISGHTTIDQLIQDELVLTCNCTIAHSIIAPDAERVGQTGILLCFISVCRLPLPLHILFQKRTTGIHASKGFGAHWDSVSMRGITMQPEVDSGSRLKLLFTASAMLQFASLIFSGQCNRFCCNTQTTYRFLYNFRP